MSTFSSNCFDVEGNPTDCDHSGCLGSDCNNSYFGDHTLQIDHDYIEYDWTDPDAGGGWVAHSEPYGEGWFTPPEFLAHLEGFAMMDQDEFNAWFLDQHDWGGVYTQHTGTQMDDEVGFYAQYINEEEALHLASIFSGYNPGEEFLLMNQYFEDMYWGNELYDVYAENAEEAFTNQELAAEEELSLAFDGLNLQNDYAQQKNNIDNKRAMLAIQDKINTNKANEANTGIDTDVESAEAKLINLEMEDTLNSYYNKHVANNQNLENQIIKNQTEAGWDTIMRSNQLENQLYSKRRTLDRTLADKELSTQEQIVRLREEHEAHIFNMLAQMAASGALFDWTEDDIAATDCVDQSGSSVDCGTCPSGSVVSYMDGDYICN